MTFETTETKGDAHGPFNDVVLVESIHGGRPLGGASLNHSLDTWAAISPPPVGGSGPVGPSLPFRLCEVPSRCSESILLCGSLERDHLLLLILLLPSWLSSPPGGGRRVVSWVCSLQARTRSRGLPGSSLLSCARHHLSAPNIYCFQEPEAPGV